MIGWDDEFGGLRLVGVAVGSRGKLAEITGVILCFYLVVLFFYKYIIIFYTYTYTHFLD